MNEGNERYKNCSFCKCELKPSEHNCKIFFNYSKLCVISFFAKKVHHQNTLLDAFRTASCNIIGRNPSMVIPLLANQDLTPMLAPLGPQKLGGLYELSYPKPTSVTSLLLYNSFGIALVSLSFSFLLCKTQIVFNTAKFIYINYRIFSYLMCNLY